MSFLACQVQNPTIGAQDETSAVSREWHIKAAYLYQFGNYVEWPTSAFAGPNAPIVIGVVTADSLLGYLDAVASEKKIQGRRVQVFRFSLAEEKPCHILFVSSVVPRDVQEKIIARYRKSPVLLVGDAEEFIELGGIIRFVVEDNNIRLVISRKSAEGRSLSIRAKLLQVARVVD